MTYSSIALFCLFCQVHLFLLSYFLLFFWTNCIWTWLSSLPLCTSCIFFNQSTWSCPWFLLEQWVLKVWSPRNLLEMQILRPSSDLRNKKLWGWGPAVGLNKPSRGFWWGQSLRPTALAEDLSHSHPVRAQTSLIIANTTDVLSL